jgi:hypothetical protein
MGKSKMKTGHIVDDWGDSYWYLNDLYHREDGPAVVEEDGHKEWWIEGKKHRTDGPAVEYLNGSKYWYLNNQRLDIIPQDVLINYMKANNYTLAHLYTDSDPFVRASVVKYKWEDV